MRFSWYGSVRADEQTGQIGFEGVGHVCGDTYGPGLGVGVKAFVALLTADPAALESAHGGVQTSRVAVQLDRSGAHSAGDREPVLEVRGEHSPVEPVGRVIRDRNRLVLVLVGENGEHWAEDLLLRDPVAGLDVGEDGRLDVPASIVAVATPASDHGTRTLATADFDVALHNLTASSTDHRTDLRGWVAR